MEKTSIESKPEQYYKLLRATKFAFFVPLVLAILGIIGLSIGGGSDIYTTGPLVVFLIVFGGGGAKIVGLVGLAVVLTSIKASSYNLIYFFWWVALLLSSLLFMTGIFNSLVLKII